MRIPLTGGAYQAKSVIASAQRCINLYPEINPPDSQCAAPLTHYLTPGNRLLIAGPEPQPVRGNFRASNGKHYVVIGNSVYFVTNANQLNLLGTIAPNSTPVSMQDNGLVIVIVDGSNMGYAIDLATNNFGVISSTNFYGGTAVCYLDTFFILNVPNTNQFYISLSNVTFSMLIGGTAFDALDIAAKDGYPDPIQTIAVVQGYIWLIGNVTSEVWYNSGAADFAFQRLPGVNVIQHGTPAPYSVTVQDLFPYWISQDQLGKNIIYKARNYIPFRISNHALEYELSKYSFSDIQNCVSYCYQQEGHVFIVFNFPAATWVYDEATELWHQRAYTDNNGNLNRARINNIAYINGQVIGGDYLNGNLYLISETETTDNGQPITRIRSWPLLIKEGKRDVYNQLIADFEVGNDDGSSDGFLSTNPPVVYLRWSDTRGKSWKNYVSQSLGATGEYLTCVQYQRLGFSRFRVFELMWSAPAITALNQAFVTDTMEET